MLVDMGSRVTILETLPRILAGTDVEAGRLVSRALEKRGVGIHTGIRVTGIEGTRAS